MKRFTQYLIEENSTTYYHGTSLVSLPSILANGLIPRGIPKDSNQPVVDSGERLNCVYLTPSRELAQQYAEDTAEELGSKPVVLCVLIPETHQGALNQDELDTDGVRFNGHIPADWLRVQ